jgi:hypothetical protein
VFLPAIFVKIISGVLSVNCPNEKAVARIEPKIGENYFDFFLCTAIFYVFV